MSATTLQPSGFLTVEMEMRLRECEGYMEIGMTQEAADRVNTFPVDSLFEERVQVLLLAISRESQDWKGGFALMENVETDSHVEVRRAGIQFLQAYSRECADNHLLDEAQKALDQAAGLFGDDDAPAPLHLTRLSRN